MDNNTSAPNKITPNSNTTNSNPESQYAAAPAQHANTPKPAAPDSSSNMPSNSYVGLTGSQLKPEKPKMLPGLYVIAAMYLLGFGLSFMNTSDNSLIYTITMFINLALTIGLLMRIQTARKLVVWFSAITLVITIITAFGMVVAVDRMNLRKDEFQVAVDKAEIINKTAAEQKQFDDMKAYIAKAEKDTSQQIRFTYIMLSVTTLQVIGVIYYLTRPKIKEAFHDLEA